MYTIIPLLHVFSSKLVMWLYPLSSNSTKSGLSPSFGRASMIQIRSGFSSAAVALHSGILFLEVSAFVNKKLNLYKSTQPERSVIVIWCY